MKVAVLLFALGLVAGAQACAHTYTHSRGLTAVSGNCVDVWVGPRERCSGGAPTQRHKLSGRTDPGFVCFLHCKIAIGRRWRGDAVARRAVRDTHALPWPSARCAASPARRACSLAAPAAVPTPSYGRSQALPRAHQRGGGCPGLIILPADGGADPDAFMMPLPLADALLHFAHAKVAAASGTKAQGAGCSERRQAALLCTRQRQVPLQQQSRPLAHAVPALAPPRAMPSAGPQLPLQPRRGRQGLAGEG